MIKKKQEIKKKLLPELFNEFEAVISVSLKSGGFANINFDDKGEIGVEFLNDEGYALCSGDGDTLPMEDIQKVGNFMNELKAMRLDQYNA